MFRYLRYKFALKLLKTPFAILIDVSNQCNLRCKHCYFFEQDNPIEISDPDLLKTIKDIKDRYPTIQEATWLGGEPLLRSEIIEKGRQYFTSNRIFTNGIIPLPPWEDCKFYVSVDGTKSYHEEIRGKNQYEKIIQNADRDDLEIYLHYVITNQNYVCIEECLKDWSKRKIRGIRFSFYTPIEGLDESLWLDWPQRDAVVDQLLILKKKYGDFIENGELVLQLFKSHLMPKVTKENCPLPKSVFSIDPLGKRKMPCVMGEKADCSRCGCTAPFDTASLLMGANPY